MKSMPFWAILLAHMGHNYGYETLMTELPTYMKQVLHFNLKDVSINKQLPSLLLIGRLYFFSEWFPFSIALFGHVVVLNGDQSCCGLDAYQAVFHPYHRS